MPVLNSEIKIARVHQLITNTAQHLCVVSITEFGHQDSYRQGTAIAQRPREMARLVIEFPGGSFNSVASGLGDRAAGNIVEHNRNRGGIQSKMRRQLFQTDWAMYRAFRLLSLFLPSLQSLVAVLS